MTIVKKIESMKNSRNKRIVNEKRKITMGRRRKPILTNLCTEAERSIKITRLWPIV